jgi:hypothetical protein
MLTVYLALVSGWGFIIVAVMLAPVFVVWYKVVSERESKQVEQLLKPYKLLSDEERSRLIESLGKHDKKPNNLKRKNEEKES